MISPTGILILRIAKRIAESTEDEVLKHLRGLQDLCGEELTETISGLANEIHQEKTELTIQNIARLQKLAIRFAENQPGKLWSKVSEPQKHDLVEGLVRALRRFEPMQLRAFEIYCQQLEVSNATRTFMERFAKERGFQGADELQHHEYEAGKRMTRSWAMLKHGLGL